MIPLRLAFSPTYSNSQSEAFGLAVRRDGQISLSASKSQLHKQVTVIPRQRVRSYFSAGMGPYYRVHHDENKITPKQQDDIMQILAKFGSTEGIKFNHYETDWDFG